MVVRMAFAWWVRYTLIFQLLRLASRGLFGILAGARLALVGLLSLPRRLPPAATTWKHASRHAPQTAMHMPHASMPLWTDFGGPQKNAPEATGRSGIARPVGHGIVQGNVVTRRLALVGK